MRHEDFLNCWDLYHQWQMTRQFADAETVDALVKSAFEAGRKSYADQLAAVADENDIPYSLYKSDIYAILDSEDV